MIQDKEHFPASELSLEELSPEELSPEELEQETTMELPDRELLSVAYVVPLPWPLRGVAEAPEQMLVAEETQ